MVPDGGRALGWRDVNVQFMFCAVSWKDHRFTEMVEHPVEVGISCGCTRVLTSRPSYFVSRLGENATPLDAERRMICQTCHQRPKLSLSLPYALSGGRDRRVDPPALPDWMPVMK